MMNVLSTTGIWTEFPDAESTKSYTEQGLIALLAKDGAVVAVVVTANTILFTADKPPQSK